MSECPVCSAGLSYTNDTPMTPMTTEESFMCPDPDCEVSVVRVVRDA